MKKEYEKIINNYKELSLTQLEREVALQQQDIGYGINKIIFKPREKTIIDFDGKAACKIFSSYFENIDFIGIKLSNHLTDDQRMVEGNIFINCSFIDCAQIASFNECVFENCTFNKCDFKSTSFIDCNFINTTIGECDLYMANFSLSNYQDIYVESCNIEKTLFCLRDKEKKKVSIETEKFQELGFNMLEYSLQLIYDSMQLNEDTQMLLDPIAHQLSEYIRNNRSEFEKDGIKERNEEEFAKWIDLHESWANQISRSAADKPEIDWTYNDYSNMDFKDRNLSEIDFSGSIMRNCDFSGANLTGANFSKCNLTGSVLYKAIFADNQFEKAQLENIMIDSKNLILFQQSGIAVNTNHIGRKNISVEQMLSADGKMII